MRRYPLLLAAFLFLTGPGEANAQDPPRALAASAVAGDSPATAATSAGPPSSNPPIESAEATKPVFDISWQHGLFFQTADGRFSLHSGATLHYDAAWYSATPGLELEQGGTRPFRDGFNLRRARIFFEGTLYEAVDYKLEIEFANGIGFSPVGTTNEAIPGSVTNSPGPTDAWLTIKDVPFLGNVRIGNQKEWFSLEHLNGYRYLEFMERSYLFDFTQETAFNNGFSPGLSTFRTWANDRIFSAVGVYKNMSDLLGFGIGDGQYAVTGRLAALPIWVPERKFFWHVGGAMSARDPVDDQVQIRIRSNVRNAPFPLLNLLANTNLLNASSQQLYNFETAAVWGPITFQAEYTANIINGASVAATLISPAGPPLGTLFFQAYYAEAFVLLTGESRSWNAKNFFFNRVIPRHPLKLTKRECDPDGRGLGAWELGVRYTFVDLVNKAVRAGELDSVTIGLNWYMNPNAKIQWNYDYAQRGYFGTPAQGHAHAFGTRVAFDF